MLPGLGWDKTYNWSGNLSLSDIFIIFTFPCIVLPFFLIQTFPQFSSSSILHLTPSLHRHPHPRRPPQQVLSTVSQSEFFHRLYPDDSPESAGRRSAFLLDLYLNTPDKGLNETPLHFASKHGSPECVRILVSYPGCDTSRPNKFGDTPADVSLEGEGEMDVDILCNSVGVLFACVSVEFGG